MKNISLADMCATRPHSYPKLTAKSVDLPIKVRFLNLPISEKEQ